MLTQRVASARQKSARAGRIRRPALESEGYSMVNENIHCHSNVK